MFMYLMIMFIFLFQKIHCAEESIDTQEKHNEILLNLEENNKNSNIEQLIIDILIPKIRNMKCIAFICDEMFSNIITVKIFKKLKLYTTYYSIFVNNSEDLLSPYNETEASLNEVKEEQCKFYIILIANGLQVARLLQYGDKYRVLNTRANFIILYDIRLFTKQLYYLWSRIVNVIFIKEYFGKISSKLSSSWFEINTVPFPSPIKGVFIPHRLDTWRKGQFRLGIDLFRDKTSDLRSQVLKVVTFEHIPAMVKTISENVSLTNLTSVIYSGLEIEILQTLAEQMNFKISMYEPKNGDVEKWGQKRDGKFSGLLGEMVTFQAEVALGDFYYSPYHLELMDLTVPYNTECLTFLTPESSTDNSWKTLILPFKLYMWLTIILTLLIMGFIFHGLAIWQRHLHESSTNKNYIVLETNTKSAKVDRIRRKLHSFRNIQFHKRQILVITEEDKPMGLYLFEDIYNTFLYTFSMLLLVSLPRIPDGWSLRVVVGWYFLYTTLVVVSYKASMTAILANPAPKITIDSLEELEESDIACGGWSETIKDFFLTSLDTSGQKIGEKFEFVNDTDTAIERVAKGEFAFYENIYFLKAVSVKRELLMQLDKDKNLNISQTSDRNLHIMSNCVINMPISIGLQKNSPIKPKMDTFIRRIIEGGFVTKWLSDIMQSTLTSEMNIYPEESNALMTLEKLYAGIVALLIGYFLSFIVLGIELSYWHFVFTKHSKYNKYTRTLYFPSNVHNIPEEI